MPSDVRPRTLQLGSAYWLVAALTTQLHFELIDRRAVAGLVGQPTLSAMDPVLE